MVSRFRHAALVGKYQAHGMRPLLEDIAHLLSRKGLDVSIEARTALATGITEYPSLTVPELGRDCDLVVVVGGDGTMLGIARELAPFHVPVVGVNQGRLGFITDVPISSLQEALCAIVAGDYEEEHRAVLDGQVIRSGNVILSATAMNDVVVRCSGTGMIELSVSVDDQFVTNFRADGLILASPTGSTAYALSAGGPIVHPGIAGLVLVPIAPHTLSNRTIVLPDSGRISIEIVAGREMSANFDMQSIANLVLQDQVIVRRSTHRVRFLHPRGWSYYATLRRKLHWNEGGVQVPGPGGF
jgi:NAD+ kinase